MDTSFTLESLAGKIGAAFRGDGTLRLTGVAPLDSARDGDLTFLTNPRYAKTVGNTRASAILCEKEIPGVSKPFLLAKNPYAALAKIIGLFHPSVTPASGIQKGAWVDATASVHPQASLASGSSVSAGAKIGARSVLYPGVFIGNDAVIGEDCLIYSNATIRENCVVGNRVILQPGAVVGSDGFGFAKDGDRYIKIPQVGNVVIEDDVELGANTCVDRAVLGTTRVGKGSKLDNLIQIGHNVVIGENTVMAAHTGVSGSTRIGNNVIMGGQVGIAGHLKIGDHVTLAAKAGVIEDIPAKGVYWGTPSTEMSLEMRNIAAYRQLPELVKRIRGLEKALKASEAAGGRGRKQSGRKDEK